MKIDCNTKILKQINSEISLYFPHTLAGCLARFSSGCPIGTSPDMDILLYNK